MTPTIRNALHADSWYTGNGPELNSELSSWLDAVAQDDTYSPPIQGCKAIIAPHAGYSYSGPTAAWAYKSIPTTGITRVFVLGPSHHVHLNGCALSKCTAYATPLGHLPLDLDTIGELRATGEFSDMSVRTDEAEHSIEMHLPYVRKVFEGMDIAIVPILVGAIDEEQEAAYGRLLAPYLMRDDTFCVVSSDFCHWGTRFSYTYYEPGGGAEPVQLSRSYPRAQLGVPIHQSISDVDHEAMALLADHAGAGAHALFAEYLSRTRNTICGRHPIGVLLGALEAGTGRAPAIEWVKYAQSSQCLSVRDSSVSYASAYVLF